MIKDNTKARLLRAAERTGIQEAHWRSLDCFSARRHGSIAGCILALREHTLAPGAALTVSYAQCLHSVWIPTAGAVLHQNGGEAETAVAAGQAFGTETPAKSTVTITNPYNEHLVNVLEIQLEPGCPLSGLQHFQLTSHLNMLVPVYSFATGKGLGLQLWVGQFEGRSEASLLLRHRNNKVLVYVVEGAFEVQNRLVEAGDVLVLHGVSLVEWEALSHDAVLLLLELPDNIAENC